MALVGKTGSHLEEWLKKADELKAECPFELTKFQAYRIKILSRDHTYREIASWFEHTYPTDLRFKGAGGVVGHGLVKSACIKLCDKDLRDYWHMNVEFIRRLSLFSFPVIYKLHVFTLSDDFQIFFGVIEPIIIFMVHHFSEW